MLPLLMMPVFILAPGLFGLGMNPPRGDEPPAGPDDGPGGGPPGPLSPPDADPAKIHVRDLRRPRIGA